MIRGRHRGPVCWVNEGDLGVPESGFYAMKKGGVELELPFKRLVAVQHAHRQSHHYRVAKPNEHSPPVGNIIEMEVEAEGEGDIDA